MKKYLSQCLLVIALIFATSVATAQQAKTLKEAVAEVREQTNGKILSAKTIRQNNKRVHVIKVITDKGRVKTVRKPAPNRPD